MIDVQVSTGTDVPMTITPDSVRKPVAEAILTFMLAPAKKLPVKVSLVCDARWDLKAQASGLDRIDLGNLAYYMFGLLRPFDIERLLAYAPFVSSGQANLSDIWQVDLPTLFMKSDFLTVICPLNEEPRCKTVNCGCTLGCIQARTIPARLKMFAS